MLSLIILIIEFMLLHVIKTMGIVRIDNNVASLLIIIFSISFVASIQSNDITKKFSKQILTGYVFRVLLLYFDLFGKNIRSLPQSGADSLMFYSAAERWALYGIEPKRGFFVHVMWRLFTFIGVNRLYAQFLLMLFSIASIIVFVHIVDEVISNYENVEKATWIICLLPNFALLSSIFLRESVVTFLVTFSVCFFIKWAQGKGNIFLLAALLISVSSCLFHSGCIGITIGYVICTLLYDPYKQMIHASINGVVLTLSFALVVAFIFLNYGESLLGKFIGIETIKDIANTRSEGGSSYARYVGNSDNPINMIVYTIPRMVYFLFSPFPWQWRGVADIIAFFFSGLFYLVTIINAIRYLQSNERENRELIICLLIVAFFCTFIFAWGVNNTGTASRHRDKMVCLYGIIYAISTKNKNIEQTEYI